MDAALEDLEGRDVLMADTAALMSEHARVSANRVPLPVVILVSDP